MSGGDHLFLALWVLPFFVALSVGIFMAKRGPENPIERGFGTYLFAMILVPLIGSIITAGVLARWCFACLFRWYYWDGALFLNIGVTIVSLVLWAPLATVVAVVLFQTLQKDGNATRSFSNKKTTKDTSEQSFATNTLFLGDVAVDQSRETLTSKPSLKSDFGDTDPQ